MLLGEGEARSVMRAAAARLLAENRGASARCAAVVAELIHPEGKHPPERYGDPEQLRRAAAERGRTSVGPSLCISTSPSLVGGSPAKRGSGPG